MTTYTITITTPDYAPLARTRVRAKDAETALYVASVTARTAFPTAGHVTTRVGGASGWLDLRDGGMVVVG